MVPKLRKSLVAALSLAAVAVPVAAWAQAGPPQDRYIVVLNQYAGMPEDVANDVALRANGQVGFVYEHALQGFSIVMPRAAAAAVARDPRVAYIEEDLPVSINVQDIPTGLDRSYATSNGTLGIDGVDDWRVDVDVAVVDTGIDFQHPDLNVVGGVDCSGGGPFNSSCVDGGDDDHYHGTHVAGTIGALDNDFGVVGMAPGARLWAVKVLNSNGSGYTSWIVAGIDWVVGRGDIEVINMSLGGSGVSQSYKTAIDNARKKGVVTVVAAGNSDADANNFSPAYVPNAITVSALADFDGAPGALGSPTCRNDQDDTLADFSNWGSAIDIAAPGVCITSTYPIERGSYGTISGTSMASPHVAGAAALLASSLAPMSTADVDWIRETLVNSGNFNWTDDSGDGIHEPLLDVSSFVPVMVATGGNGGLTNQAPTASFTSSCTDLACSFTDTSTDPGGTVSAWTWGFGGAGSGSATNVQNPSFTYDEAGTYTVTLSVSDDLGLDSANLASQSVTVTAGGGGGGGGGVCSGAGNYIVLTPSSTNQGKNWTAIVDAVNCSGGSPAKFSTATITWQPSSGTKTTDCSNEVSSCTSSLAGIAKKTSSVLFTLNGAGVTVIKP